ncbi:septal ring lytic transglycosylase RlpA family protein [Flavobacterium algicola]|uniref:septal ring lytic transglycosylase RlpA family protein n=1 Tax=Flavobacterium algicola TaxID=556529 RepID=UPI001EFC46F3|nr:septal ring lytic transglycosylase RlpA family protein [Flavobacterium algicola]MCG9792003.1 septal ring lytic transglycosylase RlpA family protein [Flavobacterium algicola]
MRKSITLFFLITIIGFAFSRTPIIDKLRSSFQKSNPTKDTIKSSKDSVRQEPRLKLKFFKKDANASYYHDKFNGRRTASGEKFDNNSYTAAHRKFPFGTKLKVTNQASGKSIIVEVTDRGPFSRGRELDLTRRGFMEIAKNKGIGIMVVTIEEVLN